MDSLPSFFKCRSVMMHEASQSRGTGSLLPIEIEISTMFSLLYRKDGGNSTKMPLNSHRVSFVDLHREMPSM
jgi:hypothetical protein